MRRWHNPRGYRASLAADGAGKAVVEALERRALLSATYSDADISGTLSIEGMHQTGTAVFDGAENITGGMFTNSDGSTSSPTGTYTVNPDGTFSISSQPALAGGINSSKDVIGFSNIQTDSLTVGINSSSGGFSNADMKGTWYEFDNGDAGGTDDPANMQYNDNSGHGTFSFDGAGGVTATHSSDESGNTQSLTGTYSVSSNGSVVVMFPPQAGNNNAVSFTGAINNSKDVAAADATNLPQAAATFNSLMVVMVKPAGVYSVADLDGNWVVCADGGQGAMTFDGAGNVNGMFTDSSGVAQTETGTYTVSAGGAVSVTLTGASTSGTKTMTLSGAFNASRNVVVLDMPDSGASGEDDMGVLVGAGASLKNTLSVQSSASTAAPGQAVNFTATVAPILPTGIVPTGTVTFFDGATDLGAVPVQPGGAAIFSTSSLALGNQAITASYSGDTSFVSSTSAAVNVIVAVAATVGGLDPTFGTMGIASHDIGLTSTVGLVVQPDGKSVIAGIAGGAGAEVFALTRYNADGSVDTTFGDNGVVDTSFGGDDQAAAVVLLGSGDILVAGTSTTIVNGAAAGSQFALAEYTSAGALDTSFGNGTGQVLTSFSSVAGTLSNDVAHALAVGPDGTIYVGGSSDAAGGLQFAVAAYTPSGTLSTAFGATGKVLLDFAGSNASIAALAIGKNDELIAAGSAANSSSGVSSVALAEFLPSGTLDGKFGSDGQVTTSVRGIDDAAFSVAVDARNNIVVGGYSAFGSASAATLTADFLLLRYTPAGKLDNTFGSRGIVITSFNQPAAISTVLLNSDGTIIASGKTAASLTDFNPDSLDLAVARYTANGQPDMTFNGTGQAIISLSAVAAPDSLNVPAGPAPQPEVLRGPPSNPFDASSDLMAAFMELTQSDQGIIATTSGGELLDIGNSSGNTVEAAIISMGLDLAATLIANLPQSVIGGEKGTASVTITEAGTVLAAGTFMIDLDVSTSANLTTQQIALQGFTEKVSLKEGKGKTYRLRFVYPKSLADGNYYLAATVDTGAVRDLNLSNNTSVSTSSTLIAQPFAQLNGSDLSTPAFDGSKPVPVTFTLTNAGNEPASAPSAVQFFASADGAPAGAIPLTTVSLHLALKPHAIRVFKTKLSLPSSLPAGAYTLLALLDPSNVFHDPSAATNFIVSGNTFVAG